MNTARLDPLVSEFDTEADALAYDQWFKDKINQAINSKEPTLPHDAAMAQVRANLERRKAEYANKMEK